MALASGLFISDVSNGSFGMDAALIKYLEEQGVVRPDDDAAVEDEED